jgi:hypothetical protein
MWSGHVHGVCAPGRTIETETKRSARQESGSRSTCLDVGVGVEAAVSAASFYHDQGSPAETWANLPDLRSASVLHNDLHDSSTED